MHIRLELKGATGLMMHNVRLADERDEYARAIKELTRKAKKTEVDFLEIERLEWYGGLYHDPQTGIYVPTWNIMRCLERAATVTRQGTAVIRAVAVMTDKVPLQYPGGVTDLAKMCNLPEYRDRRSVGVQRNKVTRVRPFFRSWSLELEAELLDDVLSLDDLTRIAQLAGRAEGLGDARKLGYGRFFAEVIAEQQELAA